MSKYRIPYIHKDSKVLLQLSGGKDSIACMILLKENNIKFDAIHFIHDYSYSLPTSMAKKACDALGVQLNIVDISKEIENTFLNNRFTERPCRYCKGIMDRFSLDFAAANAYSLICVGDTKDDKTLINRLVQNDGFVHHISRYFNQTVSLPEGISIYRPLLEYDSDKTIKLVLSRFSWFKRVNDTGDKYYEYSREGCPLQYKDYGAKFSKEMMCKLKYLNTLCGEYASLTGIRASIHLPSEFIITIPKGYEDECRQYLLAHGADLHSKPSECDADKVNHIIIDLKLNNSMRDVDILKVICCRFIERLGFIENLVFCDKIGHLSNSIATIDIISVSINRILISIASQESIWQPLFIENLCVEIFHTRNFKILNYQI